MTTKNDNSEINKLLDKLNLEFEKLNIYERVEKLYTYFPLEHVILTSSFAANSAFLLHLFSTVTKGKQKVHFIDTSYHFPETLEYKRKLTELYNLTVEDIKPDIKDNKMTLDKELWKNDADLCCNINKVQPLEKILSGYKVWVSGLMKSQNELRKNLKIFEYKNDIIKFYPILDVDSEARNKYIIENKLPFHTLIAEGYESIGCKHCTVKGVGREGRWVGLAKTECGLHI